MILTCPACQTRYQADEAKIPPQGRNVRCARCGEVWHASGAPLPFDAPSDVPAPSFVPEEPEDESYAQPSVRDAETQDHDYVAEDTTPKERSGWPRKLLLGAGWVALALVVLVIGAVAAIYRQKVVEVWPQSASLYSTLGMKVNATGLRLENIHYSEAPQGTQLVLTVTGSLTNVTNRELPVPQIRIGLVNSDKRELYHWTFAPDVMTLRPGQSTHFVTRLSSPPEGARQLDIRLAKAGE